MRVKQVNGNKMIHILWPRYFTKAGANLFLLSCKLWQGSKISNDNKSNIMRETTSGNIMLYPKIKTHDGWVA